MSRSSLASLSGIGGSASPLRRVHIPCCVAFTQRSAGRKRVVWTPFTLPTAPRPLCRKGAAVSLEVTKSGSFSRLVWSNLAAQAAEQSRARYRAPRCRARFFGGPGVGRGTAGRPDAAVSAGRDSSRRAGRPRVPPPPDGGGGDPAGRLLRARAGAVRDRVADAAACWRCSASSAPAGRWPTASPRRRWFLRWCPRRRCRPPMRGSRSPALRRLRRVRRSAACWSSGSAAARR